MGIYYSQQFSTYNYVVEHPSHNIVKLKVNKKQ